MRLPGSQVWVWLQCESLRRRRRGTKRQGLQRARELRPAQQREQRQRMELQLPQWVQLPSRSQARVHPLPASARPSIAGWAGRQQHQRRPGRKRRVQSQPSDPRPVAASPSPRVALLRRSSFRCALRSGCCDHCSLRAIDRWFRAAGFGFVALPAVRFADRTHATMDGHWRCAKDARMM